MLRKAW